MTLHHYDKGGNKIGYTNTSEEEGCFSLIVCLIILFIAYLMKHAIIFCIDYVSKILVKIPWMYVGGTIIIIISIFSAAVFAFGYDFVRRYVIGLLNIVKIIIYSSIVLIMIAVASVAIWFISVLIWTLAVSIWNFIP